MNRIALLVPVYQSQHGLERSLATLSGEPPMDIVVVDDGSTPPVRVPDAAPHTIILLRQPKNCGITAALNAGLAHVFERDYQYLARLDAGDLAVPGRFAAQVDFLDGNPDIALVGTAARYVDEDGAPLYVHRLPQQHASIVRQMRRNTAFCHPSVMMRVAMIREIGLYSEAYPAAEDYDYFYRIVDRHRTANLAEVFTVKEMAAASISVSRRKRQLWSRLRIQLEHFRLGALQSHIGVASTLAFLVCPNTIIVKTKQILWG